MMALSTFLKQVTQLYPNMTDKLNEQLFDFTLMPLDMKPQPAAWLTYA